MDNSKVIHVLSRALIVFNNQLLVTTDVSRKVSFLPGGHVEHGEQAKDALHRELQEEIGLNLEVGHLLGAIEASWDYKNTLYHEYNLIFSINGFSENHKNTLKPLETGLAVEWVPIGELEKNNIYPKVLIKNITQWLNVDKETLFETEWLYENKAVK